MPRTFLFRFSVGEILILHPDLLHDAGGLCSSERSLIIPVFLTQLGSFCISMWLGVTDSAVIVITHWE